MKLAPVLVLTAAAALALWCVVTLVTRSSTEGGARGNASEAELQGEIARLSQELAVLRERMHLRVCTGAARRSATSRIGAGGQRQTAC